MELLTWSRLRTLTFVCLALVSLLVAPSTAQTTELIVTLQDASGDGELGTLETLDVEVRLTVTALWQDLRFTMTPPAGLELVPGSVALGKLGGQVVAGNDTRVEVAFDPLPGATSFVGLSFSLRGAPCFLMGQDVIFPRFTFTASDPSAFSRSTIERVDLSGTGNVSIRATKSDGGATTEPGGGVMYALGFENGNPSRRLQSVQLRERIPEHTRFDAGLSDPRWSCADGAPAGTVCSLPAGDLACGDTSGDAVAFAVRVLPTLPAGLDQIVNTVEVFGGSSGPFTATDTTPILGGAPDLSMVKTADEPDASLSGPVEYRLTWRNDGSRTASGVEVIEEVPAHTSFAAALSSPGWSCADGAGPGTLCRLAVGTVDGAGGTGAAAFAVVVDDGLPAGVDAIDNRVEIRDDGASGPDPTPANNVATLSTPIADGPRDPGVDLAITKTADRSTVGPSDTLLFTLSWINEGSRGASSVTITETVPAHTTFDAAASSSGWSCADGAPVGASCTRAIGVVEIGATGEARFALRVAPTLAAGATSIDNTASIVDDGTNGREEDPADNTASASVPIASGPGDPGVDLAVTKQADRSEVGPGDLLTYTVTWRNGGARGASGVLVEDTIPEHTRFDASASDARWSCPDGAPGGSLCELTAGVVEVGTTGSATLAVRVLLPLTAGVDVITNRVEIMDDGANGREENPTDNVAQVLTPIGGGSGPDPGVDLVVTKSARSTQVAPGASLVYDIAWRNDGPRGASSVVLTELVPTYATLDAATTDTRWQCDAAGACVLDAGTVAGGGLDGGSAAFGVRIASPLPASATAIFNTVEINADGANGPEANPADNVATVTTPIGGAGVGPDLAITKVDDRPNGVGPGEGIVYTVRVANAGNVGSRALIEERVPTSTRFVASASDPSWICEAATGGSRCTATVGELAGGAAVDLAFAVEVIDPLPADVFQIVNEVIVEAVDGRDTDPSNDRAVVVTPIRGAGEGVGPDLFVDLDDGGLVVEPGDVVTYRIAYGNEGNRDASTARLEMAVPDGTTLDGASAWDCSGGPCTLDLGPLAVADPSGETTFTVRVDDPSDASQINATVRIIGQLEDLDPTDNVDTETTPIERRVGEVVAQKVDVIADRSAYEAALDAMDLSAAPLVIEYHVLVRAVGGDLTDAVYAPLAIRDAEYLRFVAGSAVSTVGTVHLENPGGFRVDLGDLTEGETATITFAMAVDPAIPIGTDSVACQGVLVLGEGRRVVTDDPDTVEASDPTRTPISTTTIGEPVDVPTLGAVGGGLLALLLAFAGLRTLRPVPV